MGDRVYAAVTLGGCLETVKQAETLCYALALEYVHTNDGNDLLVNDNEKAQAALRHAVETQNNPSFYAYEVNYGNFESIEAACEEVGLWCCTEYDEGGGFPAGFKTVEPDGSIHDCGRNDGDAVVPLSELEEALKAADPIAAINGLIEPTRIAAGLTIPDFTVSPSVAAWLKIFGQKVA